VKAHMRAPAFLITALVTLAGCGTTPFGVSQSELDRHRERWAANGIQNYTFRYHRTCECPPAITSLVEVEVRGGAVARVTYQSDGLDVDPSITNRFPTIDDMFATIEEAIRDRAASLIVTYDNALSYPTRISIDYDAAVADDDVAMSAVELTAF